jgi:hypothetical protein
MVIKDLLVSDHPEEEMHQADFCVLNFTMDFI